MMCPICGRGPLPNYPYRDTCDDCNIGLLAFMSKPELLRRAEQYILGKRAGR